ncbi:MAG TPA: lasso peptide biosynthesis B2 protein [Candidatus Baltobacteraceae bacterium]
MVRWLARNPRYLPLFIAIGWFLARVAARLRKSDLPAFVRNLRCGRYPHGPPEAIRVISWFWLHHVFGDRNTCYGRALTLYRFLEAADDDVRLHMGIEPRPDAAQRLRAHAWVSHRGSIVEGPVEAFEGTLREVPLERPA